MNTVLYQNLVLRTSGDFFLGLIRAPFGDYVLFFLGFLRKSKFTYWLKPQIP